MAPSNVIPDGYELLAGRSRKNALQALAAAEERGLDPQSVLTVTGGYLIPLGEGESLAQEQGEGESQAQVEEITFPDPEKDSHAAIDTWAADFPADLGGPISFEGIESETDKPTKAEKVAHLQKVVGERAAANDERLAQTGELQSTNTTQGGN